MEYDAFLCVASHENYLLPVLVIVVFICILRVIYTDATTCILYSSSQHKPAQILMEMRCLKNLPVFLTPAILKIF